MSTTTDHVRGASTVAIDTAVTLRFSPVVSSNSAKSVAGDPICVSIVTAQHHDREDIQSGSSKGYAAKRTSRIAAGRTTSSCASSSV